MIINQLNCGWHILAIPCIFIQGKQSLFSTTESPPDPPGSLFRYACVYAGSRIHNFFYGGVTAMRSRISLTVILVLIFTLPADFAQAMEDDRPLSDGNRDNLGIFVFDGSGVHDIGELLLHTGNWGIFGSYPSSMLPVSEFPSAEWPAGSGVEHLYISGLWIGATKGTTIVDQVPYVSTAAYQMEFMPTDDAIDIIYNSFEGAPGGIRLPSPGADDDGDGMIDEDWLDGHDNDGDGLIDEDFAAISPQMFSSWYTDNMPNITTIYPEHEPLDIMVRQETYQWDDERFDDFVGVTFTVTNIGSDLLDHFHFGFFMDGDIGRRGAGQYWDDDAAGSWQGYRCTELGPVHISMGYMYDADGDGGSTTSYIGAMILGHLIDSENTHLPDRVGMTSFRIFTGDQQPYENGGDPTNDFERFDAMSRASIDRNRDTPGDYRILISTGQFSLFPGQTLVFHVGLVAGDGLEGLLDNAAMCQRLFDGMWFDYDGNPTTGINRRETPLHGPVYSIDPDLCDDDDRLLAAARGEILWINADCVLEEEYKEFCSYDEVDSLLFRTGVAGRETHVNWISEWSPVSAGTLDIKPGTCKNPFNIKNFEFLMSGNPNAGGKMPVAILGGEGFDVTDIDISTIRLNGVAPLSKGQSFCDVAGPGEDDGPCHCATEGPDGYTDLLLKFSNQEIAGTRLILSIPQPGEVWTLTMTGEFDDGTEFQFSDCVTLVGEPPNFDKPDRPSLLTGETRLMSASPNPFNPATTIAFELASPGQVSITVYDVSGRMIRSLVNSHLSSGMHEVTWNGRDRSGATAASGVYFYRLVAGEILQTRKMVLLR